MVKPINGVALRAGMLREVSLGPLCNFHIAASVKLQQKAWSHIFHVD